MNLVISILLLIEIILLTTSVTILFSLKKINFPDSLIFAIPFAFSIYSILFQFLFLIGLWKYSVIIDISVIIFSFIVITKNKNTFHNYCLIIKNFFINKKKFAIIFIPLFSYLFLQAFLLPPYNWDSMTYNLARILLFQNDNTLFISNHTTLRQVVFPYGYDILHFMFLRFYTDFGLATFSFFSYFVIIIGTYLITKKYFINKNYALFLSLFISSFSLLLLHSTTTKNDIPLAAITIVIILSSINYLNKQKSIYLYLILIFGFYGCNVKSYYPAFFIPYIVLFVLYLLNEKIKIILKKDRILMSLVVINIILLCVFYFNNYLNFGNISGPQEYISKNINLDGFKGGLDNILRYVIQLFNLPSEFFGKYFSDILNRELFTSSINNFRHLPVLSSTAIPDEGQSFFGLLPNILIFPALFYTLFMGPKFLKLISLSSLIFFFAICFALIWDPFRARFMMTFFVSASLSFAFLFRRIYKKNGLLKKLIIFFTVSNMIFVITFNDNKPFPFVYDGIEIIINKLHINKTFDRRGSWIDWAIDRDYNYDRIYGQKGALKSVSNKIHSGSKVLYLGSDGSWVFPILLRNPGVKFYLTNNDKIMINNRNINFDRNIDLIKKYFDYIIVEHRREKIKSNYFQLLYKSKGKIGNLMLYKVID